MSIHGRNAFSPNQSGQSVLYVLRVEILLGFRDSLQFAYKVNNDLS